MTIFEELSFLTKFKRLVSIGLSNSNKGQLQISCPDPDRLPPPMTKTFKEILCCLLGGPNIYCSYFNKVVYCAYISIIRPTHCVFIKTVSVWLFFYFLQICFLGILEEAEFYNITEIIQLCKDRIKSRDDTHNQVGLGLGMLRR